MGDKCDIKDGCSLSELWFLMVKFRICFFSFYYCCILMGCGSDLESRCLGKGWESSSLLANGAPDLTSNTKWPQKTHSHCNAVTKHKIKKDMLTVVTGVTLCCEALCSTA